MSAAENESTKERSLIKGLVAGMVGGLVGTMAKTFAERVLPSHGHDHEETAEAAAEKIAGHELSPEMRTVAAEGIEWGLGAAVGAAYGALAEFYPAATSKEGASFGMALEAITQENALPHLGLRPEPEDQSKGERFSEMTSYVIFGITTEMARKIVRKWL